MKTIKYVITNNFSVLYDTREEAQAEFDKILNSLTGLNKAGFKFLYTVAPFYIH